ncbi:MAG: hypothetical protein P8K75_00200 [Schleiferiaceae bacterium]|nr:hypothetical protein [Schleiferiaceae bacterium]
MSTESEQRETRRQLWLRQRRERKLAKEAKDNESAGSTMLLLVAIIGGICFFAWYLS